MVIKDTLNKVKNKTTRCDLLFKQILANIPSMLLWFNSGMILGYSAILLPQLENEDDILHPTKSQESWIASLATLLMALGCVFSGLSMDYFGRKATILMSSIMSAIGWIIIYFSQDINTLLIGRTITGLSVGYSGVCLSAFIGEICDPKYRGFFLNTIYLALSTGIFIVHLLGIVFDWRTVALIITFVPTVSSVIMSFIPESHVWYVNKNRLEKAESCFIWFRGNSEESKIEWNVLIDEKMKLSATSETFIKLLEKCKNQRFIKPFLISILIFVLTQITGTNAIIFYTVQIMQSTVDGIDANTSMLSVDASRAIISVFACVLIKKYKVRPLAMISGIGTTLALLLLSLFIYLTSLYPESEYFRIIPLICFISYVIFTTIGLLPLSWAIVGEILPPETKGIGGGISATINFLALFLVVKTNPDLMENIGPSGTFAIYAVCTMIGTCLLYFFLPETRGKTLEEIQDYFVSKP